jgi:hypothetical protein
MESWLTVERHLHEHRARAIAAGEPPPCCATSPEEVQRAVRWAGLRAGDAVLELNAGAGCCTQVLLEQGLDVTAIEGCGALADVAQARLNAKAAVLRTDFDFWRAERRFEAVLAFGSTIFTFWDVEEIHRLRLRRIHALLPPGGPLIFGGGEYLGKPELEWERIQRLYGPYPDANRELRRMHETGQFMHYQAAQARTVLEMCGFDLARIHNGFTDAQPYAHWTPGMVFVCKRKL